MKAMKSGFYAANNKHSGQLSEAAVTPESKVDQTQPFRFNAYHESNYLYIDTTDPWTFLDDVKSDSQNVGYLWRYIRRFRRCVLR